jgi:16S rRNA (guanine527-N7)-methyltransferase
MTAGEIVEGIRASLPRLSESSRAAVEKEIPALARYLALLLSACERMNLVSAAAVRPEELVERHLLDALEGLPLLPAIRDRSATLLDVGSGGGFPAVPLLIVRRDLRGTLVESTGKKCRFLADVLGELALTGDVVNARFPASFPMQRHTRHDVFTSRAVARAGLLVRAARPLLAKGARALLWTTAALYPEVVRTSRCGESAFHPSPDSESRGIAHLGCFT